MANSIYTVTYKCTDNIVGMQPLYTTDTVQNHPLGTIRKITDTTNNFEGEAIYLKGVASTALNDAVTYSAGTWQTARAIASAVGFVAVSLSANLANQFGWYVIRGAAITNTNNTVAAGAQAYVTATAGALDDAVVAGDLIQNAIIAESVTGSGTALVMLEYAQLI